MTESFNPDIIIVHLGSNDLTSETALHVGASIYDFVRLLHSLHHVQVIYMCQTIMHQSQSAFNHKAKLLTKYPRVVLEPVPYAHFWGHSGFWRPSNDIYTFVMACISPCGARENFIVALEEQFWGP